MEVWLEDNEAFFEAVSAKVRGKLQVITKPAGVISLLDAIQKEKRVPAVTVGTFISMIVDELDFQIETDMKLMNWLESELNNE
ncbi:hypothetical protein BCS96_06595 [Vibrio breoganii]|uniref:hypothetical protein n=1 Tax=Vibrio breoganii TaxID=553239 RepID=UPI000C867C31|nr:hypothetical protein [Vibrio breoganii]PMG35301.1 hypothetical protein BCU93_17630 [Vibrio breoganii]PMG90786.1 hypothetical protein BCU81_05350 [Vibrio breoganii]PML80805.1 hypothetical protein BCT68_14760 [Vibrio breoganii]PML92395.1 hypothetical protein BCT64_16410 [Vibrio breoganii]PMM15523.1 hypothetical protein BCT60_06940 [Vibrio breoganii]